MEVNQNEKGKKLMKQLQLLRGIIANKIEQLEERIELRTFLKGKSDEEIQVCLQQEFDNYLKSQSIAQAASKSTPLERKSKRGNKILKQEGKLIYQCSKCEQPQLGTFDTLQGLGGHCRRGHKH